jgi:hypothetical protein
VGVWIGLDWLRTGTGECVDEPSGSCAKELVSQYSGRKIPARFGKVTVRVKKMERARGKHDDQQSV